MAPLADGVSDRVNSPFRVPLANGHWSNTAVTRSVAVAAAATLTAEKTVSGRGRDNTCGLLPETDVEARA